MLWLSLYADDYNTYILAVYINYIRNYYVVIIVFTSFLRDPYHCTAMVQVLNATFIVLCITRYDIIVINVHCNSAFRNSAGTNVKR